MIQANQCATQPAFAYSDHFFDQFIPLPDGTTVTVRDATPQQFDAYVRSIIAKIKTRASTLASIENKFRLNLNWQVWPEEDRWYTINAMAIYPLIRKQGIALFAESENVR